MESPPPPQSAKHSPLSVPASSSSMSAMHNPLLQRLMVDLSAIPQDPETPLTLATCLRQTKDVPSSLVEDLMQTATQRQSQSEQDDDNDHSSITLTSSTIRLAQSEILAGPIATMLQWAKQHPQQSSSSTTMISDSDHSSSAANSLPSTAAVLQEMLVVIQFLHLALEFQIRQQQQNKPDYPTSNKENSTTTTEMDCSAVVPNLIRSLSGVVQHFLENIPIPSAHERNQAASSSSFSHMLRTASVHASPVHPQHVAIFAWQSLLRIGNHYMERYPRLLHVLWKTLGEIASAYQPSFPSELSLQALKSLTYLLRQGTPPTLRGIQPYVNATSSSKKSLPHNFKPLKIVAFLLSRATFYIHEYHKDTSSSTDDQNPSNDYTTTNNNNHKQHSSKVFPKLLEQAALWAGLPHVPSGVTADHPALPTAKAEKFWAALAQVTPPTITDLAPSLVDEPLEWMDFTAANKTGHDPTEVSLARKAIAVGKSLFAVQVLERELLKDKNVDMNVETALQWLRMVLHQVIPVISVVRSQRSKKSNALKDSLEQAITLVVHSALHICNEVQSEHEKLQKVYFVFLSWLSEASSEKQHPIVLEVWTIALSHLTTLHRAFASLTVKLLFDSRTCTQLRSALSHVLRRAILSRRHRKDKKAVDFLEQLLVDQVQSVVKNMRHASRKRKRKEDSAATSQTLDETAWGSIGHVLLMLPSKGFASSINFDIAKSLSSKSRTRDFLMAAIASYCSQVIGTSLVDQTLSLLLRESSELSTRKVAAYKALLVAYFSQQACTVDSTDSQNLAHFRGLTEQVLQNNCFSTDARFSATRALHNIGHRLPKMPPPSDLSKNLVSIYKTALSCDGAWASWPHQFFALSAFARFSYDAPEYCQSLLPQCLTPTIKTQFTYRLKKIVFHEALADKTIDTIKHLANLRKVHSHQMAGRILVTRESPIFHDSIQQLHIPTGSYVLRMTALGTRTTTVIFPPEKGSLDDIRAMLADDEEAPCIYRVSGTYIGNQSGCTINMKPIS